MRAPGVCPPRRTNPREPGIPLMPLILDESKTRGPVFGTGDRRDRRVLMIAAAFPPTGGPGVQRTVKFAKYLPEFGWRPTVWALKDMDGLPQDASLLADLPDSVTVRRWDWSSGVSAIRRALSYHSKSEGDAGLDYAHGLGARLARALDWRLRDWNARTLLPDDWARWARTSVAPLCKLIRRENIDVIFSTFSPASNHLLGLALKRRTGVPWVADFRDLWTDDFRYCETSPRRRRAHHNLEREILESADAVIGVTPRQTEILSNYAPGCRAKFKTITNGFDPPDFPDAFTQKPDRTGGPQAKRFVMAHVGRLDRWRTNAAWFDGLNKFASALGKGRGHCELRIVGYANTRARDALLACGVRCAFTGYTSHADAIREMLHADVLLLIAPDGRNADSVIPAKLFEYLAAGRPILVVGPQGSEPANVVHQCTAGLTVTFDVDAIAGALTRLYRAWHADAPLPGCGRALTQRFERRRLTETLASVFNGLLVDEPSCRPNLH